MSTYATRIEELEGHPLPKPGQLLQVKKTTNLWCSRQTGRTVKLLKGSIVMVIGSYHVEVEEEPMWGSDDEFADSNDWESWFEMRLDIIYGEKVYKDVQIDLLKWELIIDELTLPKL